MLNTAFSTWPSFTADEGSAVRRGLLGGQRWKQAAAGVMCGVVAAKMGAAL